jgi:hypothetical protein
MKKACIALLYFKNTNERERQEFTAQCKRLEGFYGDEAEFLPPIAVGDAIPAGADAVLFPQLVGAAFAEKEALQKISLPVMVLTSQFGTVEMWDWEIVSFLRDAGLNVFSPYSTELAKVIFRAIICKKQMSGNVRFLMFQDSPGEGMQASIFKRFYWWEQECTNRLENAFGIKIIYKSYKALCQRSAAIDDEAAKAVCAGWDVPMEDVPGAHYLKAVKVYMAVKEVIAETGGVEAVGANCLNESFHSETTPCLAWNMLYEKDNILWACEGDTLTLISKYIFYSILQKPIMMTNIYPFLVGMAALKHEKIDKFPDIPNPDNHALGVHCGYFGLAPQSFCSHWTLRPKVLEIVNENALMVDCRMAAGPITMAKLHSDMKKVTLIECEIADYVQYPGSDCRNGALIHYVNDNGHEIMDALSSHHALLIQGDQIPALRQALRVFGFEVKQL